MRLASPRLLLASLALLLAPALSPIACGSSTPATNDAGTGGSATTSTGTGGSVTSTGTGGSATTTSGTGGSATTTSGTGGTGGSATTTTGTGGGSPDAGPTVPLAGFGAISGSCGILDPAALTSSSPALFVNHLDFGTDQYDDVDLPLLTSGGQKIVTDPNAGGSSKLSEAFAVEMLARCELATLLKTEMEIVYTNPAGKITDELVQIDGYKIGVSVTRAVGYPFTAPYTEAQAKAILDKKLQGVLDSTANVSAGDKWQKQILFILAYAQEHADAIQAAWAAEPAALKADTIVMVTVTDGADAPIY